MHADTTPVLIVAVDGETVYSHCKGGMNIIYIECIIMIIHGHCMYIKCMYVSLFIAHTHTHMSLSAIHVITRLYL